MNIYDGKRLNLFHLDLYRIDNEFDFSNIDIEEYISENSVVIMEWGNKFIETLSIPYKIIEIIILSETERKIRFID